MPFAKGAKATPKFFGASSGALVSQGTYMTAVKSLLASLLLISLKTFACTELAYPRSENFAMADDVLLAKVVSTKLVREGAENFGFSGSEFVEIAYEIVETFKGNDQPPIAREVVEFSTMCSHLPVTPGRVYFLFLQGEARRIAFAGREGSYPFINEEYQKAELLELRTLRDGAAERN